MLQGRTPAFNDFLSDLRSLPVQTFYTTQLAWTTYNGIAKRQWN